MQKKVNLQRRACALRKQGLSINEIHRELGVAKSSASLWVRDISLSLKAQQRIQSRWTKGQHFAHAKRRAQTQKLLADAKTYGGEIVAKVPQVQDLDKVICALLYWCEGEKSKNDGAFRFANSDPALVSTFLNLLRSGFSIEEDKLRVCVHLHDYHDEGTQLQFWSKVTNIPLKQFSKPYRKINTSKRVREEYAGCISIRYHDVRIARSIQGIARAFMEKHGPIS